MAGCYSVRTMQAVPKRKRMAVKPATAMWMRWGVSRQSAGHWELMCAFKTERVGDGGKEAIGPSQGPVQHAAGSGYMATHRHP